MIKIATWNINSLRLRLPILKRLVEEYSPDVIFLQETKVADALFPFDACRQLGYEHILFSGEKSYNGVAILARMPLTEKFSLEFYNQDKRHLAAKLGDIELHNFYVPAGGDIPDSEINPKFKHKLEFIDLMQEWLINNHSKGSKIILAGDLNIAPHEHDVWSSKQLRNVVSHTDIERRKLLELQNSLNFIDSGRHFTSQSDKLYTWWSYRNLDWEKSNRGRRLDHIWVSENLQPALKSMQVIKEARSWTQPSDHVPYIIHLEL